MWHQSRSFVQHLMEITIVPLRLAHAQAAATHLPLCSWIGASFLPHVGAQNTSA